MTQDDYSKRLGERLRVTRHQRGLSLERVVQLSGGRFSPSALGAWERGTRAITVERLALLAAIYRVPAAELVVPRRRAASHPHCAKETTT